MCVDDISLNRCTFVRVCFLLNHTLAYVWADRSRLRKSGDLESTVMFSVDVLVCRCCPQTGAVPIALCHSYTHYYNNVYYLPRIFFFMKESSLPAEQWYPCTRSAPRPRTCLPLCALSRSMQTGDFFVPIAIHAWGSISVWSRLVFAHAVKSLSYSPSLSLFLPFLGATTPRLPHAFRFGEKAECRTRW